MRVEDIKLKIVAKTETSLLFGIEALMEFESTHDRFLQAFLILESLLPESGTKVRKSATVGPKHIRKGF
jgi:hypothetical protein